MAVCARDKCAKLFEATTPRQKYCSARCRHDANSAIRYRANREKESIRKAAYYAAHPEKTKARNLVWYANNTEKQNATTTAWREEHRRENYEKLAAKFGPVCMDCGCAYPMPIYHYHHLDPAKKEGRLRVEGWVWSRVEAYVEGTVQLCPTCHVLRHQKDKKDLQSEVRYINRKEANYARLSELFGPACVDCKNEHPMEVYQYHHSDPGTKTETLRVGHWCWSRVETYVRRTVQLCPTCHALRHHHARNEQ
jgi:hypothetical protein